MIRFLQILWLTRSTYFILTDLSWLTRSTYFILTDLSTLPETNSSHRQEAIPKGKETIAFQPSIFRCENVYKFQGGLTLPQFQNINLPQQSFRVWKGHGWKLGICFTLCGDQAQGPGSVPEGVKCTLHEGTTDTVHCGVNHSHGLGHYLLMQQ